MYVVQTGLLIDTNFKDIKDYLKQQALSIMDLYRVRVPLYCCTPSINNAVAITEWSFRQHSD